MTDCTPGYVYTLSVKLVKPDKLSYQSMRKQADGKTYETDINFSNHKPGENISDLRAFIHEFCTFCN